ncbi:MAG: hypothetical protein KAT37_00085 [Candidatus Aenigmarchaeota archaeon]|nr:hypothetical protein [Candidatus Aenigmarchaeota archaeon]
MENEEKTALVEEVAKGFESKCKDKLGERLESLYITGSYAFGKISLDRPDVNFLLIIKERTSPQDYLLIGEICREIVKDFEDRCSVRLEFRPFRFINPKTKSDCEIFLNPIIQSVEEIKNRGCIFNKWFTEGLKSANKLLYGKDFLKTLEVGEITKEDIFHGALFDLAFFTIPLSRAPAQYGKEDSDLLFNEALTSGKMMCYLGIEIAMTEEELAKKEYTNYIKNKETIADFYKERYGEEAAELVNKIFDARENYLTYKNERKKAEEIFDAALRMAGMIQHKLSSG